MKWESFETIIGNVDDFIWGVPLIVLILVTGIYLTIRVRGVQVRHLGKALKFMVQNEEGGEGEVSSFGALCTALSATIGTGNIVGVATAIAAGGPGALFWMLVAAFFGMATKFAEGYLAVRFRKLDENGHALGGPFYYIERGMGSHWKWLACLFAIFGACAGLLGIGTFTQINGITSAITNFFDPNKTSKTFTVLGIQTNMLLVCASIVLTICVGLVVIGGLKRIAKVTEVVVPFMAVLYVLFALMLLVCNVNKIPAAVAQIVTGAFNPSAVTGGAVGTIMIAMQKGIARGIFSNEAGLGSAPIAAAAAKTKDFTRQGLVTMTGTFIDTIIICTMTGLSIVIGGSWKPELGLEGVQITTHAFQSGLPFNPNVSAFVLMLCLVFFAFTTILGWDYYGERCVEYLFNGKQRIVKIYRYLFVLAIFIGPFMTVSAVWTIADIFNGLMALPNLVALIVLGGLIGKETKEYFANQKLKV